MTDPHDRAELVELMSRYAAMADTRAWDEFSPTVFLDELTADFAAFGAPATTLSREAWCRQTRRTFAGWAATHHAITNHRITVEGDRATIHAHVRAEHWAPPEVVADGPNCWLVVGFYDNLAVRTPDGWRLGSIRLTPVYQENPWLVAATMAMVSR